MSCAKSHLLQLEIKSVKILVISATFPPMRSGGADYALRLCQELADAGQEVQVVTSRIENVARDSRLQIYPVMNDWSWRELPELLRIARRFRPDVLNLHFVGSIYNHHPMITLALSVIKRILPRVRVVTHIEYPAGIAYGKASRATRVVRKAVVRWLGAQGITYEFGTILNDSDCLIVLSDVHRMMLGEHLIGVDEKCVLIPPPPIMRMCVETNGAARRRGREMLGVAANDFLVAYFGYLYPGKGIETLLESFKQVAQCADHMRLVLVGGSNEVLLREVNRPDYVAELKQLSAQLGIADKVIWTGYYPTDSDHASVYLRSADTCVLPFDWGVYLNNSSFAAAAAHGLPVVTTKAEIIETPLIDGKNIILCPPKEPQAIAAAINSLASEPELRQRLSRGAHELARDWFSWDKAIQRTLAAFQGVE